MSPTTITGDHFALGADVGGFIAQVPPHLTPHPFGIRVPDQELEGTPMYFAHLPGQPHSIVVNRRGERFGDEAFYHDHEAAVGHVDGRRHVGVNWPAWLVLDQRHRDRYMLGPYPPGMELPDGAAEVADSLEQLAEATGIDPVGLAATVERFNGFCAAGVDEDFGRGEFLWSHVFVGDSRVEPNPNLGSLEQGPFYAVPLHQVATSFASAGLLTDAHARVLTARGTPVPGLHAVGNAAARLDAGGYNSGIASTRGMAFGHVAGDHLMRAG